MGDAGPEHGGDGGPRTRRGVLGAFGTIGGGWLLWNELIASTVRQNALARIDPYVRPFGGYTAYQLHVDEFVGYVTSDDDEGGLVELGYERNVMAAAKYHPISGRTDDGSWRRIDPDNPRWQWHIHRWRRADGRTELFSHYEYRPDLRPIGNETSEDMFQRIRDHYNPRWDNQFPDEMANYFLGVASPGIRTFVDG